jgi:hypothetical protein
MEPVNEYRRYKEYQRRQALLWRMDVTDYAPPIPADAVFVE